MMRAVETAPAAVGLAAVGWAAVGSAVAGRAVAGWAAEEREGEARAMGMAEAAKIDPD